MGNKSTPWRLDPGQIEVMDEAVAVVLRRKTPAERIALTADAHRTARNLLLSQIRCRYPDWTGEQVLAEVARRLTRGAN